MTFAIALLLPWGFALALTPLVMRLARAHGWVDEPGGRKQHAQAVPLLGGVAVFAACALGVALASVWSEPIRAGLLGRASLGALALGAAATVALGVWDDLRDLPAGLKAAAQVLIAVATWAAGFQCRVIELPFGLTMLDSTVVSLFVTVAWIVVVTNAFNLIDGVDGLAAGTSIAASLTIFILASDNGASVPVVASLALSGALAGFLRFNLPPARIFLGDAGALVIGYTTAVLSIASFQKSPTAVVLTIPLLILGFPLLDTILAVLRRGADHVRAHGPRGLRPSQLFRAVTRADRGHIHDLLLRAGFSVRAVLFGTYAISAGLGVLALSTRQYGANLRWGLWLALIGTGFVCLTLLRRRAEQLEREAARRAAPAAEAAVAVAGAPAAAEAVVAVPGTARHASG